MRIPEYSMWMIFMNMKEVSRRRAEKWSIGIVGASILSNPNRMEGTQSSGRKMSDGSLHTRPLSSAVVSYRGSISGNDNRGSSRYAERRKETAWQAFLYINAYVVTHLQAMIVGMIELGIHNFFWPLQGVINVFIFLRPRTKSIQKYNPRNVLQYFTATYHANITDWGTAPLCLGCWGLKVIITVPRTPSCLL
jgi:hypothetical protein